MLCSLRLWCRRVSAVGADIQGKHTTKGRSKMMVKHYAKNAVEVDGVLVSYETAVARVEKDGSFHRLWGGWTATTGRHINAFRQSHGMGKITKGEWEEMEVENA